MLKLKFRKTLKRIFFPEKCSNCGEIIPITQEKCSCGFSRVFRISENFCEHCGAEKISCSCCFSSSAFLSHITAPFLYTGDIKDKLLAFKFGSKLDEAVFFAREMSRRFEAVYPEAAIDYVCPVPMTQEEFLNRGFNQSSLLAENVAAILDVQKVELLLKIRNTSRQHTLAQKERLVNLKKAFIADEKFDITGKNIILCDDIKTTGSTLKECSDVLFAAGANDVYCLCAAAADYFVPIEERIRTARRTKNKRSV